VRSAIVTRRKAKGARELGEDEGRWKRERIKSERSGSISSVQAARRHHAHFLGTLKPPFSVIHRSSVDANRTKQNVLIQRKVAELDIERALQYPRRLAACDSECSAITSRADDCNPPQRMLHSAATGRSRSVKVEDFFFYQIADRVIVRALRCAPSMNA
jgi:hypothetical protein